VQGVALLNLGLCSLPTANQSDISRLTSIRLLAGRMQSFLCPLVRGKGSGRHLASLFEQAAGHIAPPIDAPHARKNRGWLPLLTILFLISYGLMTMLIVEQGETIESQRALIRELFRDSAELSATKMKAAQEKAADARSAQSSAKAQAPVAQNPSSQSNNQAPAKQAPSSQAAPQRRTQTQQKLFQMPSRPASDLTDVRRAVITI
jgi:hypothetical protein